MFCKCTSLTSISSKAKTVYMDFISIFRSMAGFAILKEGNSIEFKLRSLKLPIESSFLTKINVNAIAKSNV